MTKKINWSKFVVIAIATASMYAQDTPRFDAASIKQDQKRPADRRMKGGPGTNSPGRVKWELAWMDQLLSTAFDVEIRRISGPSWLSPGMDTPVYTFEAVMPKETTKHDFQLMLQQFLIEQFQIKMTRQIKTFPSYDLVQMPDGPKLKESADPNAENIGVYRALKIDPDGFPILPPGHGQMFARGRGYHAVFQSYTMQELAEQLTNQVTPQDAPTHYVVDKTGLTGKYDFKLKFEDTQNQSVIVGPGVQTARAASEDSDVDSGLPTIFKALERQLGLRLVKSKGIELETIVIEHAEKMPRGN